MNGGHPALQPGCTQAGEVLPSPSPQKPGLLIRRSLTSPNKKACRCPVKKAKWSLSQGQYDRILLIPLLPAGRGVSLYDQPHMGESPCGPRHPKTHSRGLWETPGLIHYLLNICCVFIEHLLKQVLSFSKTQNQLFLHLPHGVLRKKGFAEMDPQA